VNKPTQRARYQGANWRRSKAQAPRVRPRIPARATRSGSVKTGWIVASAAEGAQWSPGTSRPGLRPRRLGRLRVPAIERNLTLSCLAALRYATNERAPEHSKSL